jgi:hypothetical protein
MASRGTSPAQDTFEKPLMLIVGIENGPAKGFTDEELAFTNGFALGSASQVTLEGEIRDPQEFLNRLKLVWPLFSINAEEPETLPDFVNLEFVERMKEANWYTNAAGYRTPMEFAMNLAYLVVLKWNSKFGSDSEFEPHEHLRGQGPKQRQLAQAVHDIANEQFGFYNPHKAGEKFTINPNEYDSDGYLNE